MRRYFVYRKVYNSAVQNILLSLLRQGPDIVIQGNKKFMSKINGDLEKKHRIFFP